jgi:predicted RNase H-like HicB family nuclease
LANFGNAPFLKIQHYFVALTMKHYQFTAQIERDKESNVYVGYVPSLPGAHTQAESLDQLQINLREVISLCLEELTSEEIDALHAHGC